MNLHISYPKFVAVLLALGVLLGAARLPAWAEELTPPAAITPTGQLIVVNDAASDQLDPHVSGDWVTYIDNTNYAVRVHNLATGADPEIANPAGSYSLESDISGSQVVFTRFAADGSGFQGLFSSVLDTAGNPAAPVQIDADGGVRSWHPSVGNGTVAFQHWWAGTGPNAAQDIRLVDAYGQATQNLTYDVPFDHSAAVSPDGGVVVWVKCTDLLSNDCDVWQATRGTGLWTSRQLTGAAGNEGSPDTDGGYVAYASDAGGDANIAYQPVGGGDETTLVLPGVQRNPTISGGMILFESSAALGLQFDLFAYDLAAQVLYRITDTAMNEMLSDISVRADGLTTVVWTSPRPVAPSDRNVFAFRFMRSAVEPQPQPPLTVHPLFDQGKAHRAGSVVPIRFQLLDASGANVSSAALVVTAGDRVHQADTSVLALVEDAGNSSPDSTFRYDEALQGYIYNLSTRGMAVGSWALQFSVSGDTHTYTIEFDLR